MQIFTDQTARFIAVEKIKNRTGELYAFCEIKVKGNHLKGPVDVEINHSFIFTYDDAWQTEDGFEVSQTTHRFDSIRERNMAVENRFSVQGDWVAYTNRFAT